jgi:hypothetical protein
VRRVRAPSCSAHFPFLGTRGEPPNQSAKLLINSERSFPALAWDRPCALGKRLEGDYPNEQTGATTSEPVRITERGNRLKEGYSPFP